MRLQKVILPEVIRGLRGDADAISTYKNVLNEISHIGPGLHFKSSRPLATQLATDEVVAGHFALAWKYKNDGGKVFHIGKEFAEAMAQVKKDIPLDLLPDRFFAYFSFPEGTFAEIEGAPVRGGFIFIGPPEQTMVQGNTKAKKVVWINYELPVPKESRNGREQDFLFHCVNFCMPLDDGLIKATENVPIYKNATPVGTDVQRAFMNLAVYIHSLSPDLMPTRAVQDHSNKQRKDFYTKHGVANHCTLPVIFVSWNYRKPTAYSVDSTTVNAHFRWQRCGPGFSQVKLILIDEHERHFKKGDRDENRIN